jgi:aspartate-semialdehyde dehydrogenase
MKIAVVVATGLVGSMMLKVLEERNFPLTELIPVASERSVGKEIEYKGKKYKVVSMDDAIAMRPDIALFSAGGTTSLKEAPRFAEVGTVVIDNSSAWRMEPTIPLVVPEVNAGAIAQSPIIANPNCSTIQLVPVLTVLNECFGLKRVVVSTYQSVSGAGKVALDELWSQTLAVFNQKEIEHDAFQHQIAFNCIPQIDVLLDDGYTKEEMKIINETRKILNIPQLRITATAVRVPVFHSHAESVNIETERAISLDIAKEKLHAAGIVLSADGEYPMQLEVAGRDEVHVGRMRLDSSVENGLNLWIVADNIRKGAALNAVQILEYLLQETH